MLKDHSTLYIFTDCKELITRNMVDGQSILFRRKRAMTMLVPFSGKYCFHDRMEMEAGDPKRLSRTVAPKLPPPTAELAEERKFPFATQDNEST